MWITTTVVRDISRNRLTGSESSCIIRKTIDKIWIICLKTKEDIETNKVPKIVKQGNCLVTWRDGFVETTLPQKAIFLLYRVQSSTIRIFRNLAKYKKI
ncbi:hypothetical protein YC2023_072622 [Brassica napus]